MLEDSKLQMLHNAISNMITGDDMELVNSMERPEDLLDSEILGATMARLKILSIIEELMSHA